ncbi:ATP-binding protein [Sphaerisporangium siamense]|uniref:Putative ATPase n=1 Tax=Sphaerisporangium siamense TaxID=795645 RepID=A0A7W7GAS6_9ACTN|nr:BTAD domain-containing putative transcriptional regulator [Sphaerisporangium siamense]MBB4702682.1 putative ATPase [Sphaerisporangium siamense]
MDGVRATARTGFAVLGPLEVRRDGAPVRVGGGRLRALLTLLLLSPGRTVPYDLLVEGVWHSAPPAAAGNALQALVSRLRASLGRDTVQVAPSGYRLAITPDQVDTHHFTHLTTKATKHLSHAARSLPTSAWAPAPDAAEAVRLLEEALALWRGPALADLAGSPVAAAEVARLDNLRLTATEDLIDARLLLGHHEEVIGEIVPLIAAHPLRERLRGQHMRALRASGRQVEALAAYEAARTDFAERLGSAPSAGLSSLHVSILRDDSPPGAPTPDHRAAVPEGRKGNLRARLTSFVGRERDVAQARALLARHRLVTLVGPGGAGKTRLAIESGDALRAGTPDGVWLAELAPVRDPAGVPQAVLSALGMRDIGRASVRTPGAVPPEVVDPVDRLVTSLAGRRRLIILDNCEHVVEAAALLAEKLLLECPDIRILATSREPLGVSGELVWPVRPLDQANAEALFADRAATARPGYRVEDEPEAVARVCRELDGMPLAIELAAARLRGLSAAQIADRLDDRFRLLTGGSRTALPRHQTLRAVVEWSWDLLDETERLLAARFAVFAGGATLEAAEAICSDTPPPREQSHPSSSEATSHAAAHGHLPGEDVLDVLARLVDKSLVVREGVRYRMLETVRAYAAERLAESGERDAVRRAHAGFFLELAATADPELRRARQVEWLAVLSAEHDNLTAALRWAIDSADRDLGLRLVGALGWYWFLAGRRLEGARRAAEILALTAPALVTASPSRQPPAPFAPPPSYAAFAATGPAWQGDAGPGPEEGVGIDEARRFVLALTVYGILLAGGTNHWQEAKEVLGRAVVLGRAWVPRPWPPLMSLAEPVHALFVEEAADAHGVVGTLLDDADPWVVASGHLLRAHVYYTAGRIDLGEADLRVAVDRFREVGDRWGVSAALGSLAEAITMRGDNATIIEVIREALALTDEIGSVEDTPYLRARLAMALSASGDVAGAQAALEEAIEICRATGDRMGEVCVQSARGDLAREAGDHVTARRFYEEAVGLAADGRDFPTPFTAVLHASMGMLAEEEGHLEAARASHAEALRLARGTHDGAAIGLVLIARAGLSVREGDPATAARLLGAAAGIRGVDAVVGYDHARITEAVAAALGQERYSRHFAHGRSMSRERALGLARP